MNEALNSVAGRCARVKRRADLLEEAEVVALVPDLGDLFVVSQLDSEGAPGRVANPNPGRRRPERSSTAVGANSRCGSRESVLFDPRGHSPEDTSSVRKPSAQAESADVVRSGEPPGHPLEAPANPLYKPNLMPRCALGCPFFGCPRPSFCVQADPA